MLAVQLIPLTPTPLLPTAPIGPAVWVPWLLSSAGLQLFVIALNPCVSAAQEIVRPPTTTENADGADQTFAARSAWV